MAKEIAAYDFRSGTAEGLARAHPALVKVAQQVAQLSGLTFQYLIATMYVESGLHPEAGNGDARGIAQIKPLAWKDALGDERFDRWWKKVAPGEKIPSGPGQSMVADIVALAVLTKKKESDCGISEWRNGDKKDKARRLCYHLHQKTALPKIKEIFEGRTTAFKDPNNQKNWNRFLAVLDKAKLASILAGAK